MTKGRIVCFFDIDGTLIRTEGAGKLSLERAFDKAFGMTSNADGIPMSGRTDRAIIEDCFRHHSIEVTPERWQKVMDEFFQAVPICLGQRQGYVLPGIRELLDQIHEDTGFAVGLLTGNTKIGAAAKLNHFNLHHYFKFGGYGDEHLDRDHVAAAAMTAAIEHVGGAFEPETSWVFGDTPLDIKCARAIGAKCVALATGWHPVEELQDHKPDLLLRDLSDAESLWKLWRN